MKFEAKDSSDDPVSTATGAPWVSINQINARLECRSLNTESGDANIDGDTNSDGTYALISNPEWMTIARNVENVPGNWTSGTVGTGCLKQGNVGSSGSCSGAAGYNGEDPESGAVSDRNALAKLALSNGEEIWDLSGNVNEWVDWDMGAALSTVPYANRACPIGGCSGSFVEFNTVTAGSSMPANSYTPGNPSYTSIHGIGRYFPGTSGTGGAALRGGIWSNGANAGVFALDLYNSSTGTYTSIGFRCVFRP